MSVLTLGETMALLNPLARLLARTSAEVGTEAANLLRKFDVSLVRPALPIRLVVDVKTPTPAMVELLREWLPSDRLQPQARAIEEATGDGGGL